MMKSLRVASLLTFTSIVRGNIGVILLTIIILTLVSLNLLFIPSLLQGLVFSANDQLRNTYSGDIIVESDTASPLLNNVDDILNKIEAIDGVVAATPRNSLGAEFVFENERTNAVVYGIQPDGEKKVFTIHESMVEGSYLSTDDRDKIVLGIQLAGADNPNLELYARSLLKVHAGDEVIVTYGNGVQKKYTVKGIFHTEFIQTDIQALVSQAEMESIYPQTKDRAVSIHVKVKTDASMALKAA
jgi:putative ABC transport system permease protein